MFRGHSRSVNTAIALVGAGLLVLVLSAVYARAYFSSLPPHVPTRQSPDFHTIQDWMTVRYISRNYRVPEQPLLDALNINAREARFLSLAAIARRQHKPTSQVLDEVRAIVSRYQEQSPATPSPFPRFIHPPGS